MSQDYYHSIDVLSPELAEEVYLHLGKACKVTHARSDRPYTTTENMLPDSLVDRVRDELDNREIEVPRVIFYGAFKAQYRLPGDPQMQAMALAGKGFSGLVIADTLGYSYQTLQRWAIDLGRQVYQPNGTKAELAEFERVGRERVLALRPDDTRSPRSKHYLLVGAALTWLQQVV